MKLVKTLSFLGCAAAILCSQSNAQEAEQAATTPAVEATKALVANTEDGVLKGNVFTTDEGVKTPISAKVTLSSDGVVVDTVEADETGSFAFQGIEPGSYQLLGSADGFVGGQAFDVQPFAGSVDGGGCSACSLGLQSVEAPFQETVYQAPASACGCNTGCSACGGGGGGGLLGGGGGGLLNSRRLLGLGAIGGIVAIAVSDDDDDDVVSADE